MAKFYSKGSSIFQSPEEKPNGNVSMGFHVAVCDNGCGDERADAVNACIIVNCLNRDDELKDLATWLLGQKTLHLNKERRALLEGIVNDKS